MIPNNNVKSLLERLRPLLLAMGVAPAAITLQAHFMRDLGLDSLDQIDLMMRMEQEFFLSITDEQMSSIQTVDQALSFLQNELLPDRLQTSQGDVDAQFAQMTRPVSKDTEAQPR